MSQTALSAGENERMIEFAARWMPYGGGPAEGIRLSFGIAPKTYFGRLEELLSDPDESVELDRARAGALLRICRRRLRQCQ